MKTTLIIFLATICSFAHAGKLTLDEVCNLTKCSEERKITVRVNKDGYFQGVWPKRPFFYQNLGSVLMGESLSFEATADKDGNVTLRHIPDKTNKSININLTQPGDKPEEVMSMVHIENNSDS